MPVKKKGGLELSIKKGSGNACKKKGGGLKLSVKG